MIKAISYKMPISCPHCGAMPGHVEYRAWQSPDGSREVTTLFCGGCSREWEIPGPDDDDDDEPTG
jgi:hypothetical protein